MTIVILVVIAAAYAAMVVAAMVVAWRWLLRRWRLVGPDAPPRALLGREEYLARRSLRALLAFDFLVILPIVSSAGLTLLITAQSRDLAEMLWVFLSSAVFFTPIPVLRRSIAREEQRRREGLPAESAAESKLRARSTGHAALDAHLGTRASATNVAALVIVLVSLAAWRVPQGRLLQLLVKDDGAIRSGQVWRLLTVALVHAGLLHLALNVLVLLDVGAALERLAGKVRMLLVLLVGTAAGSALSVACIARPSVGASGGVLALAAALLALGHRHRAELPPGARRKFVRAVGELLALNLVLTFVLPNVDWAAHLGGIVAGAVLGWFSRLRPAAREALAAPPGPEAGAGVTPGVATGPLAPPMR